MKWIVLDFGTKKIKALKINQDGQRLQIEDFYSFDAKPDYFKGLGFPDSPGWAATTIALDEHDWLKPDEDHVIIAALPSAYLETRYLKFPFKTEKKIEKVLNFELEATIPFDIDEIQIRSQILEGDGVAPLKKESLVMAMAYRRSFIKQIEGELKKFQLSNPPLTVQILALSTLRHAITEPSIFGILEIGHSKSEFLCTAKSGPILGLKTFWWGGKNLIQSIQDELSTDAEKAEHILSDMDPEKPLTKGMKSATKNFASEIRLTLKAMETSGVVLPKPLMVYAFGRPTKNAFLMRQIEADLKTEFDVQFLPFPFPNLRGRQLQGFEKLRDLEAALPALSIALSQSRSHRGKIPSFSETGFQFQQNLKKLKTGSFSLMKKVAALLIAPFIYALLQIGVQRKENQVLLSAVPNILKGSNFELAKGDSTDDVVARMKKELAANRNKIAQLQENDNSPLVALTQISKAFPAHLKIDVKEFNVTPTSIFMSAETNSSDTAKKLIDSLKSAFPKLKAGEPTNCTSPGKQECKTFTVEIERQKT
ncbi:MAG: hypothetical protein JWQ35_413 [Bacteriovoracaceae bacterium]|nr:hypothetical protein [Bacteriovoracaceae bacterium]